MRIDLDPNFNLFIKFNNINRVERKEPPIQSNNNSSDNNSNIVRGISSLTKKFEERNRDRKEISIPITYDRKGQLIPSNQIGKNLNIKV